MKSKKNTSCCDVGGSAQSNPDHVKELHRISRISGQLDGVRRMIIQHEYCPKIITQLQAVRAALKSLESVVLEKHLGACVRDAMNSNNIKEANTKVSELMELFRRS